MHNNSNIQHTTKITTIICGTLAEKMNFHTESVPREYFQVGEKYKAAHIVLSVQKHYMITQ